MTPTSPNPVQLGRLLIKVCLSYLAAVTVAYLLASLFQTLAVLQALTAAGGDYGASDWLRALLHDLYGLAFGGKYVSYAQTIAIGLAIALPSAAVCLRWLPLPSALVYALAGATAMLTILLVVKYNFYDLTLFAGSRGVLGMGLQMLAGALGGWVFARFIQRWQRAQHA